MRLSVFVGQIFLPRRHLDLILCQQNVSNIFGKEKAGKEVTSYLSSVAQNFTNSEKN